MALKILDDSMSSDHSPHTARLASGEQQAWEVSWLPGRRLDRNEAVTAMVLADTTGNSGVHPGHRAWPHIENWAGKLGMTGSQVLDRVAGPPRWAQHEEKSAEPPDVEPPDVEPPDVEPPDVELPDVDPLDGWAIDDDWDDPYWSDPDCPGSGPNRRPTYMFNLVVSDWYKEHYPDKSANVWDVLHAGRDPQPGPKPDKSADWEAGQ
jgi:hypothetical protein